MCADVPFLHFISYFGEVVPPAPILIPSNSIALEIMDHGRTPADTPGAPSTTLPIPPPVILDHSESWITTRQQAASAGGTINCVLSTLLSSIQTHVNCCVKGKRRFAGPMGSYQTDGTSPYLTYKKIPFNRDLDPQRIPRIDGVVYRGSGVS